MRDLLLLGVDGGGTHCRARLASMSGQVIGEGIGGPANIRVGLEESFASVLAATLQALGTAGLGRADCDRIVACLAFAGATEPAALAAARGHPPLFQRTLITSDAHAACVGAHGGADGGIVIAGTGSIGWAVIEGRSYRVGGWGFPVSDEGSGAWLGCEGLRRVLWAHDGRTAWTGLLRNLFARFADDPHAVVRFMGEARPRDFARLAPAIAEAAGHGDAAGAELLRLAAEHVGALIARIAALAAPRLSLLGGLAAAITPYLPPEASARLVPPQGGALAGALHLARLLMQSTETGAVIAAAPTSGAPQ